ncbi:MAG: UDP-N-acetylmuramoyl-tripeptide--D-alanyl-D-alanine ligase [Deltaproteobacteria bacterium]|nr:UDP-N-acetylmuramoyl-tripeptide--D-alanyl-D-alanine ligase [Deltaproteobacteria bacterium]
MRYRLFDVPSLFRTPLGRLQLRYAAWHRAGPFLYGIAHLYRTTVLRKSRIVVVVGSFGKTTTARAVISALGGTAPEHMPYNSGGWVARSIFSVRPGQAYGVIEVGINDRGQMTEYARTLRPDVAVVTSIGSEHNRRLGSLEATRAEKVEMVRVLSSSGWAVLNGDDPNVRWMAEQTRARVITFGFGERNDVRATNVRLDWPDGTRFTLHTATEKRSLRVRLIGRTMVYPILAAVAVALNENFSLDDFLAALEALDPTPGRLQPVRLSNGAILLRDEFKSPLETIDAALDILEQIPARRRIVVLGDVMEPPGPQNTIYRRLGQRIAEVASRAIVFTGSNVRFYRAGARLGGLATEALVDAQGSMRKAIEALESDLGPGDVVLIKGRDTQRLERLALMLMGRNVRCELKHCGAKVERCDQCPMLERGWNGMRVTV